MSTASGGVSNRHAINCNRGYRTKSSNVKRNVKTSHRSSAGSKELSKSQRKRASFNYRASYFEHNPGLFHCIWFCSQCHKPLIGKKHVEVDHIVPLAGAGINRTFNTVAICHKCNQRKKAKAGLYSVNGAISKVFEKIIFTIQKIIIIGFTGLFTLIVAPFKFLFHLTSAIAIVKILLVIAGIILVMYFLK